MCLGLELGISPRLGWEGKLQGGDNKSWVSWRLKAGQLASQMCVAVKPRISFRVVLVAAAEGWVTDMSVISLLHHSPPGSEML